MGMMLIFTVPGWEAPADLSCASADASPAVATKAAAASEPAGAEALAGMGGSDAHAGHMHRKARKARI